MSKAEERALEAYPVSIGTYSDNCQEYDTNEADRATYQEGYEQAEKDNALTWEDVKRIVSIADMMMPNTALDKIAFEAEFQTEEMFYKEVLKRYNNGKQ